MSNPSSPFNAAIRSAGNRSRAFQLPNIGQDNAPAGATTAPMQAIGVQDAGPPPVSPSVMSSAPINSAPVAGPSPMAAPRVQPSTFTMHPPGTPADPNQYNYEPQADGSWRVYPPGTNAPAHTFQASLPRAASTGDYMRMANAFRTLTQQQQQQSQPSPTPQAPPAAPTY